MPRLVSRTMRRRNTRHHVARWGWAVSEGVTERPEFARVPWHVRNGLLAGDADLVADVQV